MAGEVPLNGPPKDAGLGEPSARFGLSEAPSLREKRSSIVALGGRAEAATGAGQLMVLRLALLNSLFALALVAARLAYGAHVHPVAYVAVGVVLFVYGAGSVQAIRMALWPEGRRFDPDRDWQAGLRRLDRLAARCPKVAMAGTVAGFLIAFSGSTADVAQRVRGASTGLAATLTGIVAMLLLELQHDWLAARRETY
jgi:hypothetical protein